ncbi:17330_t:CDS:2 [Cetraspora pellucida]|uniref:17330_t:CDS:1 n=1 Tax=Cetraspora pellucida TaxID=1433469 RepID=A0ACA9LRK2_9GLOM|nr:17330_t:CDS:2 [Cetraspora pellucida]
MSKDHSTAKRRNATMACDFCRAQKKRGPRSRRRLLLNSLFDENITISEATIDELCPQTEHFCIRGCIVR